MLCAIQLSLAEAKSLWSIIQHREHLMALILTHYHFPLVPRVKGFCGDLVAVDIVKSHGLFSEPSFLPPSSSSLYPISMLLYATYSWPDMKTRLAHSSAMVDLIISQLTDGLAVVLCNAGRPTFYGFNSHLELRVTSFDAVFSISEMNLSSNDGVHCTAGMSGCSFSHPACRGATPRSVARSACELMVRYLLPGSTSTSAFVPPWISYDGSRLVDACRHIPTAESDLHRLDLNAVHTWKKQLTAELDLLSSRFH